MTANDMSSDETMTGNEMAIQNDYGQRVVDKMTAYEMSVDKNENHYTKWL
jgi:hypothetical protein